MLNAIQIRSFLHYSPHIAYHMSVHPVLFNWFLCRLWSSWCQARAHGNLRPWCQWWIGGQLMLSRMARSSHAHNLIKQAAGMSKYQRVSTRRWRIHVSFADVAFLRAASERQWLKLMFFFTPDVNVKTHKQRGTQELLLDKYELIGNYEILWLSEN